MEGDEWKAVRYPSRASPGATVSVRPGGRAVAAARSAGPGASLPHAHPVLFAADHSARSLSELAAGSPEQLCRAPDVPGEGQRVPDRSGSDGRNGRLQSVRLLSRAVPRALSVLLLTVSDYRA